MSAPILATKLYIPPPRPNVVLRPRLIERLNEGLRQNQVFGRKLTLISAPAGFGKTTLVRQARPLAGTPIEVSNLNLRVLPPQVTSARVVNRPDVRRASIPGGGGIMNARAVARHYAMLAGLGQWQDKRLLSAERVELIRSLQIDAHDEIFEDRNRKGLGYMLGGSEDEGGDIRMGRSGGEFGHPGNGGSLGFADPARKLGFGLTKNLMKSGLKRDKTTAYRVAEAMRQHLDRVA